jgi:predicted tellurium resistance membrane protein TerC
MFEWLTDPHVWASFIALSAMEIVLGIDNVVFISVMVSRMAPEQRLMARRIGLSLALVFRVIMLAGIAWFIHLTTPIFSIGGYDFSWRDLVLIAGGLFLLVKGTREMHQDIEGEQDESGTSRVVDTLTSAIIQIAVIDLVFSIDSIITAVGMADHVEVMIAAVSLAIVMMMVASGPVSHFISHHPTVKMLGLSFLLLIGLTLVADAAHFHIPRGYLYFAVAFSMLVEALNIWRRVRRKQRP